MAGGMNLDSFDQAIDLGNDLKEIVNQITESKNQMMSKVNALCDIWQSAASQHYNEEFTEVANKIDTGRNGSTVLGKCSELCQGSTGS